MTNDIKEVLISEQQIIAKCEELGKILSKDYEGKKPLFVGFLKGCVPFMAELMKHISIPMEFDFMDVSSYFGTTSSSGQVKIIKDLDTNIENRHVLIVEDIVDTGITIKQIIPLLLTRKPSSIEVITLLDKPSGRKVDLVPKYYGFTVPKVFLVGFGLDYNQLYRNLPFVGVLKEEVYSKWDQQ